jgi:hypothetical protein
MDGYVELCLERYDPVKQWYFFRWPPDAPISFREYDSYSYQKTKFGLDFLAMSEKEPKAAACRNVEEMSKRYAEMKK